MNATAPNSVSFLRLKANGCYAFRPVGPILMMYKGMEKEEDGRLRVTNYAEQEYKREWGPLIGKLPPIQMPKARFAMNCIDRDDEQLKVVEFGVSVMQGIKNRKGLPFPFWGEKGATITVSATGEGLLLRYDVVDIIADKLTKAEIAMVMEKRFDLYRLITSYAKRKHREEQEEQRRLDELDRVVSGLKKHSVTLATKNPCTKCRGLGWLSIEDRCEHCNPEPTF